MLSIKKQTREERRPAPLPSTKLPRIEPTTRLLGLDPSMSATGWAVGSPDGTAPVSGVFSRITGTDRERVVHFYEQLTALHDRYRFEIAWHEYLSVVEGSDVHTTDVSESNRFSLRTAIDLAGHILGFKTFTVQPHSWRKSFLGFTGKPPWIKDAAQTNREWLKDQAVAECRRRGWPVGGHDEAEARGIMDYGLCQCSDAYAAMMAGPLARYGKSRAGVSPLP